MQNMISHTVIAHRARNNRKKVFKEQTTFLPIDLIANETINLPEIRKI